MINIYRIRVKSNIVYHIFLASCRLNLLRSIWNGNFSW